jgi:heme/copper-type cytochrome/quinol oxidase subunit 4
MKTIIEETFEEKNANALAIGSFIISTILFTLYIVSNESPNILVIAWPFAFSAIFVNLIMFIHLVDNFIKRPNQRKYILNKILILVMNIPVVYLYYTIVMKM